jgi:hypothetical protein
MFLNSVSSFLRKCSRLKLVYNNVKSRNIKHFSCHYHCAICCLFLSGLPTKFMSRFALTVHNFLGLFIIAVTLRQLGRQVLCGLVTLTCFASIHISLLQGYRLILERRFARPNDPESYVGGSVSC